MALFRFPFVRRRQNLRCAAGRSHPIQAVSLVRGKDNRTVRAPGCSVRARTVTYHLRRAAADRHFLQPSIRETEPATIRREEWAAGIVGSFDRLGVELVETPYIDRPSAVLFGGVRESGSIGRQRDVK